MKKDSIRECMVIITIILSLALPACREETDDTMNINAQTDESLSSVHDMTFDASVQFIPDALIDASLDENGDAGLDEVAEGRCAPELGLYQDERCERLADGVIEYTPQYPLWSDGTVKYRFAYLPPDTQIDTTDPNKWIFPVGTKLWKHFQTGEGKRLETRVLTKVEPLQGPDAWLFETYVWNELGDTVTSIREGQRDVLGTSHDIPRLRDCDDCHSGGKNKRDVHLEGGDYSDVALGFDAIQLNHDDSPTTLIGLIDQGLLSHRFNPAGAVIPGDVIAKQALGYLHGNCGSCHGGAAPAKDVVMRVPVNVMTVQETPTYLTNVGQMTNPGERATGLENLPSVRIVPGDAQESALVWRMKQRSGEDEDDDAQMPPLATEQVDHTGVDIVSRWINELE